MALRYCDNAVVRFAFCFIEVEKETRLLSFLIEQIIQISSPEGRTLQLIIYSKKAIN